MQTLPSKKPLFENSANSSEDSCRHLHPVDVVRKPSCWKREPLLPSQAARINLLGKILAQCNAELGLYKAMRSKAALSMAMLQTGTVRPTRRTVGGVICEVQHLVVRAPPPYLFHLHIVDADRPNLLRTCYDARPTGSPRPFVKGRNHLVDSEVDGTRGLDGVGVACLCGTQQEFRGRPCHCERLSAAHGKPLPCLALLASACALALSFSRSGTSSARRAGSVHG